jgi:apolipoprotein N-acyltransferase
MAPFHIFPVLWLTLPVLVWLIEAEPATREDNAPQPVSRWQRLKAHRCFAAAGGAWWFGFGYFFAGLVWVAEAFLVEARQFAVFIPFVISGLPALLAAFWAAAAAAARWPNLSSTSRVLLLAVTLALAEYARGHVFTGFPWNVIGYALTAPLPLMQSAAYVGIYGLTLVAILIFALPLVIAAQGGRSGPGLRRRLSALAVAVVPLALMFGLGSWRLATPPPCNPAYCSTRSGARKTRSASSMITSRCRSPVQPASSTAWTASAM